ncbi:MAG TPA: Fur family transcriptional regulator [Solirubrobacterales bacterium]|nr:Fur family transcriptional regulator [Solirubrobacterales bacterium]
MPSTATVQTEPPADLEAALVAALRRRGQRVTPQRLAVARLLAERREHVTAEDVYQRVAERLPGVSLPTVYATLDLLEELGLIRRLLTESGAVLYDPELTEHHHLVCAACGEITDIEAPLDDQHLRTAARRQGFTPDRSQVVVSGLCRACRQT